MSMPRTTKTTPAGMAIAPIRLVCTMRAPRSGRPYRFTCAAARRGLERDLSHGQSARMRREPEPIGHWSITGDETGHQLSDQGRKLRPVSGARRANEDRPDSIEQEVLTGC